MHAPAGIIDPQMLMLAYRSGIFPMADSRDDAEVFWVEPKRRAILPLDGFHLSHSLARTLRRGRFRVTCNAAFGRAIEECAGPRRPHAEDDGENGGTWISHRIEASYLRLHALGLAHSVECWQADADGAERLVGGLYGVGFDRVFCGESMFSRVPDASKVALAWLVAALRRVGAVLLDCQFMTGHLASLGAVEIDQADYLARLKAAQSPFGQGQLGEALALGLGLGLSEGLGAAGLGEGAAGAALALPEAFGALLADATASSSSPGNFIAQALTQTS